MRLHVCVSVLVLYDEEMEKGRKKIRILLFANNTRLALSLSFSLGVSACVRVFALACMPVACRNLVWTRR